MLDQDTARALLDDRRRDRRPGRVRRRPPPAPRRRPRRRPRPRRRAGRTRRAVVTLETVHRFADPDYADLSLRMRTGDDAGERLRRPASTAVRSSIHASEVERTAALDRASAPAATCVIADTREQVADLNAAIRDQRRRSESGEAA